MLSSRWTAPIVLAGVALTAAATLPAHDAGGVQQRLSLRPTAETTALHPALVAHDGTAPASPVQTVFVRFAVPAGVRPGSVRLRTAAGAVVVAPVVDGDPVSSPASVTLGAAHRSHGGTVSVAGTAAAQWMAVQQVTGSSAEQSPLSGARLTLLLALGSHPTRSWRPIHASASPVVSPPPSGTPAPSPSTSPSPAPSASPTAPVPSPSPTPSGDPVAATRTMFGTSAQVLPGETGPQAVSRLRGQFGSVDALRLYSPGRANSWSSITAQAGSTPVVMSFKESPTTVLSGALDSYYRGWFAAAPRDHVDYWTYWHEPEDDIARGAFTATQYRAAWAHLKDLADQAHNPQLKSTLILMGWTLEKASGRRFADYYPGDSVIDVLGWDVYNHASTGTYNDPAAVYGEEVALSRSIGKPFGIAETGSLLLGGDTGAKRAAWLLRVGSYLSAQGALFVTYFDSTVGGDFRLLDAPSMAAWRQISTEG